MEQAEYSGTAADGLLALTTALSAAADPGDILDVMADACPDLLGADLVNISLLEDEGRTLRLVSSLNTPLQVEEEFTTYSAQAQLPSTRALETGDPVVLRSRAQRDELYPQLAGVDVPQDAFCVVPLISGRTRLGVLGLGWKDSGTLDDEVVALARVMGVVCATALGRALAAQEEVEARYRAEATLGRLRALQAVAAELAHAVDVEQAVGIVLERAMGALGAEAAILHLLDETGREATQIAAIGIDESPLATRTTWRVGDSLVAQELMRTGLPVLVSDSATRHERFPDLDGSEVRQEAWANLLLASAGTPLGLMSLGWAEARQFDVEDVALLQALADHLAAALDRARLDEANTALLEERTRVAATLQKSLLPAPLPVWDGVVLAAGYEPADVGTEVCGDFYDVFEASDGSLVVVVGDVAGRGVEAAGLTGMARHTLRALARDMSPRDALIRLNDALIDAARWGDQRLLTAAVVRLRRLDGGVGHDGGRVSAEIALAGHCLPVLVRDRTAEHVGEPGMLLGATAAPPVGRTLVDLAPDDVLLLHTDGVLEARRHGVEFGEERLLRLLAALSDPGPDEAVEHVLNAVRWYRTTAPDDVAVVALRVARPRP